MVVISFCRSQNVSLDGKKKSRMSPSCSFTRSAVSKSSWISPSGSQPSRLNLISSISCINDKYSGFMSCNRGHSVCTSTAIKGEFHQLSSNDNFTVLVHYQHFLRCYFQTPHVAVSREKGQKKVLLMYFSANHGCIETLHALRWKLPFLYVATLLWLGSITA